MSKLKKLAGDTVLYGVSSIVGRTLSYFLVPLYTKYMAPSEYGIVTELYSYVAFFMVLFNFGMGTTFFRFTSQNKEDADNIVCFIYARNNTTQKGTDNNLSGHT